MKAAIAQYPIIVDSETPARQQSQQLSQKAVSTKSNAQATAYAAKFIVILSGITMMYCLINYGRIFQNYLQW